MWVAYDRPLQVAEMANPICIALYASLGHVVLDPFVLAVMPGADGMHILGFRTLEFFSLAINAKLTEC